MQKTSPQSTGIISYNSVHDSHLRQRKLKPSATGILLWALGVGAVIPGDYYGWNLGLEAGFWGLGIATVVMAVMYFCLIYSLAEMAALFPYAGSLYAYTRIAFGPLGGYVCGILVATEYILATAALIVTITTYIQFLVPSLPLFLVWILLYAVFMAIVIYSVEVTWFVSVILTLLSIAILVVFYGVALTSGTFNPELLFNVPAEAGQSATWLPKGWQGVFTALPYAIWFYLAIEILPLASEETQNVPKHMPRGLIAGMWTLVILSLLTLVINTGVGGGAVAVAKSSIPLVDGLEAFAVGSSKTALMPIGLILGLAAGAHTLMFGYGRILFALSRAGYIPRWLSVTSRKNTPYRALFIGSVLGIITIYLTNVGNEALAAAILNMSVFAALITYILVTVSYIKLKFSHAHQPRPYKSPLGVMGALIAASLALVALAACFYTPTYRAGIFGVLLVVIVATLYFLLFSRKHLVLQAPEEAAAISGLSR
jgi:ethanolamine permease